MIFDIILIYFICLILSVIICSCGYYYENFYRIDNKKTDDINIYHYSDDKNIYHYTDDKPQTPEMIPKIIPDINILQLENNNKVFISVQEESDDDTWMNL
jgi:hypothetical protein